MKQSTAEQVVFGIIALLLTTLLAYLLQAVTTPLVRLYEGYWPEWFPIDQALADQQRIFKVLTSQRQQEGVNSKRNRAAARAFNRLYYSFPPSVQDLRPTRFGNTLATAEVYPHQRSDIVASLWWPRLVPLLPKPFLQQIEASFTPVLTMLNLATLLIW